MALDPNFTQARPKSGAGGIRHMRRNLPQFCTEYSGTKGLNFNTNVRTNVRSIGTNVHTKFVLIWFVLAPPIDGHCAKRPDFTYFRKEFTSNPAVNEP